MSFSQHDLENLMRHFEASVANGDFYEACDAFFGLLRSKAKFDVQVEQIPNQSQNEDPNEVYNFMDSAKISRPPASYVKDYELKMQAREKEEREKQAQIEEEIRQSKNLEILRAQQQPQSAPLIKTYPIKPDLMRDLDEKQNSQIVVNPYNSQVKQIQQLFLQKGFIFNQNLINQEVGGEYDIVFQYLSQAYPFGL